MTDSNEERAHQHFARLGTASGFELRTLAVSARAAIIRLRDYIEFDETSNAAFDVVNAQLAAVIEDAHHRDEVDTMGIIRIAEDVCRRSGR